MFNSENLQEKWQPVLSHPDLPEISDSYKRAVTAVILENQEQELAAQRQMLEENTAGGNTGVTNFDPVLISLVRRAMPNLIAYDVCGVQPMTGPTGLIFAMKTRQGDDPRPAQTAEGLFDEVNEGLSNSTDGSSAGAEPGLLNDNPAGSYTVIGGDTLGNAEAYSVSPATAFQDMSFSIEKTQVVAKTRALRATYTMELAQDLKAIHGLDAESELSNILSTEILAEINREVVRTIYIGAEKGALGTTTDGVFDLDTDSNGRWSVEKFKGLIYQIERDCNHIGIRTRRGKGNILLCSADVASALSMAGVLDYAPSMSANLRVDPTGNTFAGTINGRIKVYIDPYASTATAGGDWYVAGYKGTSAFDAGLFYCPYVPLQMVRAVSEDTFQPRIAFKTRYGMALNPMAEVLADSSTAITDPTAPATANKNSYYRRVRVSNLM